MSMFASTNNKKPTLAQLISHDLAEMKSKSVPEVYLQTKTILKALTGRPHEYTMEEALFILREEKVITEEEYDRLKPVLVSLIFYKYATHYDVKTNIDFSTLESILTKVAEKSETTIETYAQMRKNPLNFPENTSGHDLIKQHKKELYETEQQLFKEMSLSNKVNINFPDIFEKVIGASMKDIHELYELGETLPDLAFEIHVKYQLVKGKSIDWIIREYLKSNVSEEKIKIVLHNHKNYLDSLQDILYLKEIILIMLAFAYCLVSKNDFDKEEDILKGLGYNSEHINFVREQITRRILTT